MTPVFQHGASLVIIIIIVISKLRASSHILEIERGRYTKPKVPPHLRLYKLCNVEDEEHFVTECVLIRANDYIYSKEYVAFILMLTH